jgi:chaperonin GroEL (HSP60 family)
MPPKLACPQRLLDRKFLCSFPSIEIIPKTSSESEFFSNMAVDAMLAVKNTNARGETKYPVKAVNILKAHGKSAKDSIFVKGYALNLTVASQGILPRFILFQKHQIYSHENPNHWCQNCMLRY